MDAYNSNTRSDTPRNRGDYSAPLMGDVTPGQDFRSILINRIAWSAIFSGVFITLAVQLVLNLCGLGIGIATITPDAAGHWSVANISAGATVWLTISGIIAMYFGGYAAGRLSGEPVDSTAGWHGFTVWAVSLVVLTGFIMAGAGVTMVGMLNTTGMYSRSMTNMAASGVAVPPAGSQAAAPAVPPAGTTAETAPAQGAGTAMTNSVPTGVETVSPAAAATAALLTVLALVLGAIAAWLGGRAGCIKPTVTPDSATLH